MRTAFHRLVFILSLTLLASCSFGEIVLKEGDNAPDFTLPSDDGQIISLSDFKGRNVVVLYFYPKDNTPGCTTEACSFRDSFDAYKATGIVVLGVSTDDVASHKSFRQNHQLNFTLLSDDKKKVSAEYGVLGSFGFAGRVTFLIDKAGKIRKIFKDVSPDGHAAEVLAIAKSL
ncbi:MAG: thioredoxin-dependent thiol peroxidase [Chlorobiales bacterium]|jgi:thioredoxin-dependent peroxiredoxin|nr:thioredoxin-dependent thiol peroxidase [Chlorobiales bacterium]